MKKTNRRKINQYNRARYRQRKRETILRAVAFNLSNTDLKGIETGLQRRQLKTLTRIQKRMRSDNINERNLAILSINPEIKRVSHRDFMNYTKFLAKQRGTTWKYQKEHFWKTEGWTANKITQAYQYEDLKDKFIDALIEKKEFNLTGRLGEAPGKAQIELNLAIRDWKLKHNK